MTEQTYGTKLPLADKVMRYCKPSASKPLETIGKAFTLRENETGLSVQWLDYLKGDLFSQIQQAQKKSHLSFSLNGWLVIFKIEDALDYFDTFYPLEFIYKPSKNDKSHSEIIGLPQSGSLEMQESIVLLSDFLHTFAKLYKPIEI
jgi:hypothetical protein